MLSINSSKAAPAFLLLVISCFYLISIMSMRYRISPHRLPTIFFWASHHGFCFVVMLLYYSPVSLYSSSSSIYTPIVEVNKKNNTMNNNRSNKNNNNSSKFNNKEKSVVLKKKNGSNNNNNNNNRNELLTHILKQLRPFQREAYDFAVEGLSYQRQYNNSSSNNNNNDNATTTTNISNNDNANGFSAAGWISTKKSKTTSSNNTNTNNNNNNTNIDRNNNNLLLGKGRILLADEMGLGKTITSLAIMTHYYPNDWPLLILCPASLKYTWPGEIEKFLPELNPSSIYVVNGFDDADFYENPIKKQKIRIVIASYSLLQNRSAAAKCLQQFQFQSIIVDESHNLKQPKSQRTKLALPLLKQAKRLVLLSGTPALARPVELYTQISIIAPKLFASSYTQYTLKYCNAHRGRFGWDVSGISNSNELHSKLKQIMVRRKKIDVLHELPAKQRSIIPITISTTGNNNKKCQSIIKELNETRQSIHELVGEQANSAHFEARKLLMKAYQVSGIAKVTGVCEYLLEWLRNSLSTQKVLIFAHHKEVLDKIENVISKEYKGIGHIRIDGTVPSQERALRVKKFQTNPQIRVAVLSMTAAGVGLTLTAASTVMFAELHWTPGILAQAEDRCHRIGQRNAVNILYLINQDQNMSIDISLWCMLGKKIGNLGKVIDGNSNAYLNAELKDDDDDGNGNGRTTGQQSKSVQDEIQDFFAETSQKQKQNNISSTPVKGSIMSFFQKQKHQQSSSSSSSSSEEKKKKNTNAASSLLYSQLRTSSSTSPPSTTSSSSDGISKLAYANNGINHPTNIKTSPYFASSSSSSSSNKKKNSHRHHEEEEEEKEVYEWACEACTYINTKKLVATTRKISLVVVCDICGRSHKPIILSSSSSEIRQQNNAKDQHHGRPNPSPTVTPTTNRNTTIRNGVNRMKQKGQFPNKASNHDIVVLDDSDDDDELVSSPEQTKRLSNTQSSSSPTSETPEPIVIDPPIIATTTTMKKINSSREKPIELLDDTIDDDDNFSSPPHVSKKAKSSSSKKRRPPPSICSSHDDDDLIVIDEDDDGPSSTSRINRTSSSSSSNNRNQSAVLLKDHKTNARSADSTTTTAATEQSQSNLPITKTMPPSASPAAALLAFSVSRNSGRITLHYAVTGKSSLTNFELEQILSDECSGKLMEAQITRKSASSKTLGMTIEFKYDAIDRVVRALDHSEFPDDHPVVKNGKANTTQQLKKEIQDFVQNYLQLREVEKKAIRDSECHFVSSELKRAVLRIMTSSSSAGTSNTTERYAGGARERSRQRIADNIADEKDLAILDGRLCAWCGGSIPTVFQAKGVDAGTYCGRECAERGRLNTSSGIRQQIFALEGGKCRICGIDAFALYTRIISLQPAERLNALCNVNWKLPKSAKALDKLLLNPKEGDFWEADHIHAVSEGGGSCGIDNIRTLCVPCHQEETSKLHHRLKLNGGPAVSTTNSSAANNNASDEGNNKRQRDIRDMFKPVASHQKNNSKRFRGVN